ncbi:MAG TPA: 50S ribosomal protein L23 [Bacteroidia bacterium]|nr:50S ribosomal protein L23 [Bacteroidia bacterium]
MSVIKKPIITEKMTAMGEKGRYGFIVDKKSNKVQIKQAVETMYGVSVDSVNTMIVRGKSRSRGTKSGFVTGQTPTRKKAVVTLKQGETIDFYSSI